MGRRYTPASYFKVNAGTLSGVERTRAMLGMRPLEYKACCSYEHCSISVSPKGWTDQELGSTWLEHDFEPETAARNTSNGYRLLILDGHNSHCTYRFCKFAEQHRILILCLPSHTTHVLQPCDVGVFGPLSTYWKAQVNKASRAYTPITKSNLLLYYHTARENAFRRTTIAAAFRKTGIHPLDPNAIDKAVFEPAKNTTTQAVQALPARLPELLLPILETTTSDEPPNTNDPSTLKATTMLQTTPGIANQYLLVGIPPQLPPSASRHALETQIEQLRAIANAACIQIQKDYTQMVLMDSENERLRQRAFSKQKKAKTTQTTAHPRHMTSNEVLEELALADWRAAMKKVHKEAMPVFQAQRKAIDNNAKQIGIAEKARKKADKERERVERRDAIAAAKTADRLEKERLKLAKKAQPPRRAARQMKGKGVAQKRKVQETESDSEELSDCYSESSSDSDGATPPTSPPSAPSAPRVQRPRPRQVKHLRVPTVTMTYANGPVSGSQASLTAPQVTAASETQPHPQPVTLTNANDEGMGGEPAADGPVPSGSSVAVHFAGNSSTRPVLRRSQRHAARK